MKIKYEYRKPSFLSTIIVILAVLFVCRYFDINLNVNFSTNIDTNSERIEVEFVRHIDGDTTVFNVNGEEKTVRYLAIDTEETVHPTEESTELGYEASEYVENKLQNATLIELEFDPNSDEEDYYGRLLAWIWVDGELLQLELVELDLATVAYVYDDYKYLDELYAAENAN